jgi:uncharacterized protein (DUF1499 family)
MSCFAARAGCDCAVAQTAAPKSETSAAARNGERMMVVTVNELYRRRNRYDEPRRSRAAVAALSIGLIAVAALASTAPLYRTRVAGLATTFLLLRWSVYAAIAALLLALIAMAIALRRGSGRAMPLVTLLLVGAAFATPVAKVRQAARVPRIHDITTDTERPPQFVAVAPLRAGAANPIAYGGAEIAAQQRRAYPRVQPLTLPLPPNQAFDRALAAARAMGWEIIASDPPAGRIEATDTTFWFGFKDDVVVRVEAAPGGSRVDVRSLSRVGLSDVGTNAARIEKYVAALKEAR